MKKIYAFLLSLFALLSLATNVWGETAIYTVQTKTSATLSGNAPAGSSATYQQTYNTVSQLTKGNSATLTLSGYTGYKITGITLSMKSNASAGAGTFSAKAGAVTLSAITSATNFNNWFDNKSYGTAYRDVHATLSDQTYVIGSDEKVIIQISATTNSLYIQSYTITYEPASVTEYDVTWSVGGTTSVNKTQGGKAVLPADPDGDAIGACADTFMGWSATKLGSVAGQPAPDDLFTTADDAPVITANTTFYAVFAKATTTEGGSGSSTTLTYGWESTETYADKFTQNFVNTNTSISSSEGSKYGVNAQNNAGNATYIQTNDKYAVLSVKFKYSKTTANTNTQTWVLLTSTDGKTWTQNAKTYSASGATKGTWSDASWSLDGSEVYVKITMGTSNTAQRAIDALEITCAGGSSTTYSDYVTECVACTNDLGVTWRALTAANVVRQTAMLSWDLSATNSTHIAGYSVHVWSTGSTVYNKTFTVSGAATKTLALTDLVRETDYAWTVTALTDDPAWCTATSGQQTFKTQGAEKLPTPGNPKVVYNPETNDYTFSWDAVPNATKYTMTGQFSGDISGTSSTRGLSGVIPGNEYTVTVTAKGDNGVNYIDSDPASYTFTAHVYTLTLSVTDNGTTTTQSFTEPKVTLPAETSTCEALEGWTFAGWSETDITEETTTTSPTLIAAGTEYGPDNGYIKSDRTLYAVFKKTEEGGGTEFVTLEYSDGKGSYSNHVVTKNGIEFQFNQVVRQNPNSNPVLQLKASDGAIYNKDAINLKKITVDRYGSASYTIYIGNTANPESGTTITSGTDIINGANYFAIKAGGSLVTFRSITIEYTTANVTYTTSPSCIDCNDPNNHCPEYPLVLNDRGVETTMDSYWVGEAIEEPQYTPQGGCDGYEFAGWTTEAGLSNLTATEWASKQVTFPVKMPKKAATDGKLTLYAVYSSVWTDEYRSVTDMSDLTTGEYVITAPAESKEHALSFVRADYIENFGSQPVEITQDEDGMDIVSTTNPEIIWTITETAEGGYTLEALHFDGMQNKSYLNIVSNYLQFEETAKPYTISEGDTYAAFTLCSPDGYCLSYNGQDFVADETASPLYLYKRVKDTRYSTSTACDPSIISVGTVAVTSAPGIWVEAVTQPYVFAERLQSNRDGAASVDIIATSKTAQFTLKAVGATGAGSASLTLKAGETRDNFADRFMVVYKPSRYNVIDEGEIVVKAVNAADHSKEYAVHTIRVKGRSLPNQFVIAAQTADGWVALPADLGTSSLATLKAPYRITVDDANDPATATQAPETAIYHAVARFDENTNPRGVHLMNSSDMRLCGDYSKDPDSRLWFAQGEVTNSQSWALRSLALKDYYIRLQAAPAGNYLFYNATEGGKIGYYTYQQKNRLRLRLLPVDETCVRYDAPTLQVAQLKSEYVVLQWPVVEGMPGYEYSLDEGGTWTAFDRGTDWEEADGMNKGTISGLAAGTDYTVWVRVATPNGEPNCSDYGIRTFTSPDCDDVPTGLWASATADAVNIMWNAESPTATVKIYSDKDKTNVTATQEGAKSPCKITGLEQNTTYWYQVFTGGTCASAIASFITESNEVNIVEWEKEAVIVDINTEVTDADDVSIVVENRVEHGDKDKNVAEDLFFSKYYEASGTTKLLAIYNGTKEDIDLTNITIHTGIDSWNQKIILKGRVPNDIIKPNQEIIFWTKGASNLYSCVEKEIDTKDFVECVAGDGMGGVLDFSGQQSIALARDGEIIDLIGAITKSGATISGTNPKKGACKTKWGDLKSDQYARCGWGYSIEDKSTPIELSTNRCLLVRSSSVKSGKDAVEKNVVNFVTLGDEQTDVTSDCEWLGRQVENNSEDNGVQSSCDGFAYVAGFDYNDYYTTFEEISETELKSQRNPNGTYTIPVARLDTLACTDIRLQLKKGGEVIATREQKVPIIITASTATDDALFSANGLDETICSTCDVVVRDQAKLTHAAQGVKQFHYMHIYHGSRLEIPEGTEMTLDKVRMFALNDTVSYAILNNTNTGTGITVKEVSHVKRIDGKYWYPFSLPYDCRIADIGVLNGGTLGTYGIDWGIKYYDGERRQRDGNSTTAPGAVSKYWTMMSANGTLEANKGYIIGLFVPASEEAHQKSINFAPATIEPYTEGYTEGGDSKTAYATNWPDNLTADARHHGWNFVGSPYISTFGAGGEGEGLYNTDLKMGYTDIYGEQQAMDHIYVTIPDGGNTNTYTQRLASGVEILPFTAYFVQTIDPEDGVSHDIELVYRKGNLTLQSAPQRVQGYQSDILVEMTLSQGSQCDNAGVWVGNRYTTDYEIGRDLDKMYSAADKPQLYTLSGSRKMAYNAVSDVQAQHLPVGLYVPSAGDYTLSVNPYLSRTADAEAVYLLYEGSIAANLLTSDYRFTAAGKGNVEGYTLDIRRARSVTTGTESAEGGTASVVVRNGQLTLLNLPADAEVQVYDMLGRIWLATLTTGDTPQTTVPDLPTGVYTVVITTADAQQVIKTILR